jgi:dolichol-phosphate hexosyltransferase
LPNPEKARAPETAAARIPALAGPARRKVTSTAKRLRVTVAIPARNEETTLGAIIEASRPYCDEVLVIDGHSTDGTAEVARRCGAEVIVDNGKGKGAAIRQAAQEIPEGIIVFLDADGSHDPGDIPRLVEPIQEGRADLVIGSRGKGGSDELHGDVQKLIRLVGSDIILIGINWRWKADLTDSQNGFRAIRAEVMRDLELRENITTIEQEMTMKCLKKGYVVSEVPAHEYARIAGQSTIVLKNVWFRYVYCFLRDLLF